MSGSDANSCLWQAKLHARLHDPAEKALVLLRDPTGHEGGTVRALHDRLFADGVPQPIRTAVKHADWWASAADRPQFPRTSKDGPYAAWTQVRFDADPVLIHPLSGQRLHLKQHDLGLRDTDIAQIKQQSQAHFKQLLDAVGDDGDHRRLAMALWRFGPELPRELDDAKLGELWRLLPADTRVPDHSIWDHLDLTAAFAGPLAADAGGECALLSVSLGPVQEFIAAARTASDLWAGSHLLSRMAWEAMKVVTERLGPDAILFPRLRGVALVDLWLQEDIGLPETLFEDQPWRQRTATDANPLFAAALPNRFLAAVPAKQAEALAEEITERVRAWTHSQARNAFDKVQAAAGQRSAGIGNLQIDEQLAGFPEVHWSVAPYNGLIDLADEERQKVGDTEALRECLAPFFDNAEAPGFLGSQIWQLLRKTLDVDGVRFYEPNPGALYPAIHELADRAQAAAKTTRAFTALPQSGYRCSLTGTAEWLTDDREQLQWSPGEREANGTLWTEVARNKPAWARKGEHLGALATLKRLWPTLFVDEIEAGLADRPSRFVVSTHAMALTTTLEKLAEQGSEPLRMDAGLRAEIEGCERSALPRRLIGKLRGHPDADLIARIPAWLDQQHESENDRKAEQADRRIKDALGEPPEAYYALVLMDGDHMGRWLAGDSEHAISYKESFHPTLRQSLDNRFGKDTTLQDYLNAPRALSPNRHLAISGALGDFSSSVARQIAEEDHMGRLLYAGGDDLMAMVTAGDLLPMMAALRGAYAGQSLDPQAGDNERYAHGYYHLGNRLYMTMGDKATASMGAVIAHHQAPLGHVQRALKAAEQRAKNNGERNAFCIQIIKRSGGAVTLTLPWAQELREPGQPSHIRCLQELSGTLASKPGASRRAAYNVHAWLHGLPEPDAVGGEAEYRAMVQALLHQQFQRQGLEDDKDATHSRRLARLIEAKSAAADAERLENLLSLAEFLARECRSAS